MNFKETLFFVAKCLTISIEKKNRESVEKQLKSKIIDWNNVVKVSTAHLVLSALYCNFQRCNFLHYLPKDLVTYMKHISNLNRERNKKIMTQAIELNNLLLANCIKPIFLKGTANLLAGIYQDTAERMVGDIDFICSKEEYPKAITVLRGFGYSEAAKYNYHFPATRHYRKLQKDNDIAAIEIHSEILRLGKYRKEFNYNSVKRDAQLINKVWVLSYNNKLNLSIISNQINDSGFYYKTISLRNAYDVFLFSKKTNAKDAVNALGKLTNPSNCFLAACYTVFNETQSLEYNKTKMTNSYLNIFNSQFTNPLSTKIRHIGIHIYLFLKWRMRILVNIINDRDSRIWFVKRLTDKNRYLKLLKNCRF